MKQGEEVGKNIWATLNPAPKAVERDKTQAITVKGLILRRISIPSFFRNLFKNNFR